MIPNFKEMKSLFNNMFINEKLRIVFEVLEDRFIDELVTFV
jgi:hypothetical protein